MFEGFTLVFKENFSSCSVYRYIETIYRYIEPSGSLKLKLFKTNIDTMFKTSIYLTYQSFTFNMYRYFTCSYRYIEYSAF